MLKTQQTEVPEKVIIGVDPGTQVMGYGVISVKGQQISLVQYGVIHLSKYSTHEL
jgi:crossover junction endodeoxyribonuclease RuvC